MLMAESLVWVTMAPDKAGHFVRVSAVVFEYLVDRAALKAHACNKTLALVADLNLQRMVIALASDCLEVITNIKKGATTTYAPVHNDVTHRIKDFNC